jgi:hypothetical protein
MWAIGNTGKFNKQEGKPVGKMRRWSVHNCVRTNKQLRRKRKGGMWMTSQNDGAFGRSLLFADWAAAGEFLWEVGADTG